MSEEDFSKYCKAYQEMKQNEINKISEWCKPTHKKSAGYRRQFFKINSNLPESEWYLWKKYYFSNDWETDIWIMTNDEFKYSWPYHAGFIEEFILHNLPQDMGLCSEDMINHNGDLNNLENFMTIFVAYNQKNIAEGKDWDNWPEWELCLTEIKDDLHFEAEDDEEETVQERKDWLALMQFIHDSDAITQNGYTISIQGEHGTQFRFELGLVDEVWLFPGEIESNLADVKNSIGKKYLPRPLSYLMSRGIEHSLGEYWICPKHVPKYGGKGTAFTHEKSLEIDRNSEINFPADTLTLIKKCIADTDIWVVEFEKDLEAIERAEWMEENWPGGIPDQDWEYQ